MEKTFSASVLQADSHILWGTEGTLKVIIQNFILQKRNLIPGRRANLPKVHIESSGRTRAQIWLLAPVSCSVHSPDLARSVVFVHQLGISHKKHSQFGHCSEDSICRHCLNKKFSYFDKLSYYTCPIKPMLLFNRFISEPQVLQNH